MITNVSPPFIMYFNWAYHCFDVWNFLLIFCGFWVFKNWKDLLTSFKEILSHRSMLLLEFYVYLYLNFSFTWNLFWYEMWEMDPTLLLFLIYLRSCPNSIYWTIPSFPHDLRCHLNLLYWQGWWLGWEILATSFSWGEIKAPTFLASV